MAKKLVKASDLRKMEKALRKTNKNFRTIMRLARLARDEADALAKKGVHVDEQALKRIVYRPNKLLEAHSNAKVRALVRSISTIDVGTDFRGNTITVNYQDYIESKKLVTRFNKSVRAFNEYHKAEIAAGTVEARREKKWTLGKGKSETQESANNYLEYILTAYTSPKEYELSQRRLFYAHLMKAIENMCPVGADMIIDFFRDRLKPIIETWTGEFKGFEYVYDPKNIYEGYKELAKHYGILTEFLEMKERNKKTFLRVFGV